MDVPAAKDPLTFDAARSAASPPLAASPSELFVEITTHCNLRCPHCPRESDEGILSGASVAHLKREHFPRVAEAMRAAAAVHTCGLGEPTLHHGLEELCRLARAAGHALAIRTNGVRLSPELAARLADAGAGAIHVSIDGGSPETFARLRPPADPARVLANLTHLVRSGRVGVVVHTLLTPETLRELPALVAELARIGVRTVSAAPRAGTSVAPEDLAPSRQRAAEAGIRFEFATATPGAAEPGAAAGPGLLGDLPATSRREAANEAPPVRALCMRPFTTAYVASDGRIGACENGLHRLGSIATQTVADAFSGRAFEELRRKMTDGVVPPECRSCVLAGAAKPHPSASPPVEPRLFELSAFGEARVRATPELSVDVSPLVRKKGAATIPVDALVRLRASRPRRVRVGLEWRANGAREWLSPPRIEELPAGLVRDVHLDAPVPPALDGADGLALRFLVEDAATGRVLVDETHAVAAAAKKG